VPSDAGARKAWLGAQLRERLASVADKYRAQLIAAYGPEAGSKIQYAEAFEGCEYGSPLSSEACRRLFPFWPGGRLS
jgi:hypothetical protein